jgi:neutral ceramidase
MFPLNSGQNYGSVHDPLQARALVLDNGASKLALVSVDVTSIQRGDELYAAITQELGIPRAHILLSATHNHNAPRVAAVPAGQTAPPEAQKYFDILKRGIVAAVRQANARLQPARLGFGEGRAYVNTNRDEKLGVGYHMGYAPEGTSDKTVAVLSVTTATGTPLAVYANYPVHGVVMYRVKTKDGHVQITSDLPGATANYLEERLGNNAVALWTSGAAGDQNPLFMANYNQDGPDVLDLGPSGYAVLEVQARRLGEEILRVTRNTVNTTDRAVLWGSLGSTTCPGQQRAQPPDPNVPQQGYLAPDPATVKMIDADPVRIPLHLLMINDVALAGVHGEVFSDIGMQVKRQSLFDRTMMVTVLPNGIGYIPSDQGFAMPSEKAVGNRLKPGCAEPAIVSAFQGLMRQYLPVWQRR